MRLKRNTDAAQAANFEAGGGGASDNNDDDSLVRFELIEIIVRLAFSKFIDSREMSDASDAVEKLVEEYILPNVPPQALVDPNDFRFKRMYTEGVETVLLAHRDMLFGVFQVRTHILAVLDFCFRMGDLTYISAKKPNH